MFHQYGCLNVLIALCTGAETVLMPRFNFVDMLKTIEEHKVSVVPLVPPIAVLLAKHPATSDVDLSSIRMIVCASASLSVEVIETITTKYHCDMLQGYGLTECTLTTHFLPAGALKQLRAGSVGNVMPFCEVQVQ